MPCLHVTFVTNGAGTLPCGLRSNATAECQPAPSCEVTCMQVRHDLATGSDRMGPQPTNTLMCGGAEALRSVDRSWQHDTSGRHVESMIDVSTMTESDHESDLWSVHGGANLQPNAASADRLSSDRSRMTMQPSAVLVTETLSAS